jgi:molybdopterin synthase sulfur carrier subunit
LCRALRGTIISKTKNMSYEPTSKNSHITVKLFAIFQEVLGTDEMQIELESGTSVSEIFNRLVSQHPNLEQWRSLTRYAVNRNFTEPQTILKNGDEVALIPPVSGG